MAKRAEVKETAGVKSKQGDSGFNWEVVEGDNESIIDLKSKPSVKISVQGKESCEITIDGKGKFISLSIGSSSNIMMTDKAIKLTQGKSELLLKDGEIIANASKIKLNGTVEIAKEASIAKDLKVKGNIESQKTVSANKGKFQG